MVKRTHIGKNKILRYYKQDEFEKIPLGNLVDIVGDFYTTGSMELLESWERHFKSVGTPFCVTRSASGNHKIWKRNEVFRK